MRLLTDGVSCSLFDKLRLGTLPFPASCDTLRLERVTRYMSRQAKSDKPTDEYANFENALRTVLSVPHSKLKSKLSAEKRKRPRKPSASRALTAH